MRGGDGVSVTTIPNKEFKRYNGAECAAADIFMMGVLCCLPEAHIYKSVQYNALQKPAIFSLSQELHIQ